MPVIMVLFSGLFYFRMILENFQGTLLKKLAFFGSLNLMILIIMGGLYLWHMHKCKNFSVILDDKSITHQNKAKEKSILWNEIVSVKFLNRSRSTYYLVIKSKEKTIRIAEDLEDFRLLIREVKSRVGDLFNTRSIPYRYK